MPRKLKKLPPLPSLPADSQSQSMWGLGHSYELAARSLRGDSKPASSLPTLFLLLHALELFLKAYLLSQGATERELRAAGHDLVACIKACRAKGFNGHISLEKSAVVQVIRVNRYYADKELEYFMPRAKSFGNIDMLHATVCSVGKAVVEIIWGKAFRELYRAAA